jgi:hypothetical protein
MKKTSTVLYCVCVSAVGLVLLAGIGSWWGMRSADHLPPEERVRQQFQIHRADFIRFAELLRKDASARSVSRDGEVDRDEIHSSLVPEYRELMRKIEAKAVIVGKDGSVEFEMWGVGCAICSDSNMGVRYVPEYRKLDSNRGWEQVTVTSLESAALPQEKGSVATGLYVVPIEPNWFVYRFEYRE